MTTVPEVVVAVDRALDAGRVPHAFGGAIALAYAVGEPRATIDVDVNVFVDAADARRAFVSLPSEVRWSDDDVAAVVAEGQVRVWWGEVALDLFFDYHPFHAEAARHAVVVPFGDESIPVLGADDLAVFKAFFNRTKDWADIEAMAEARSFDPVVVTGWLIDLLGEDDERVDRLRRSVAEAQQG